LLIHPGIAEDAPVSLTAAEQDEFAEMKAMLPELEETVQKLESHQDSIDGMAKLNALAQNVDTSMTNSSDTGTSGRKWSYQLWEQDYPLCAGKKISGIEHNEWQSPVDIMDNEAVSPPFSNMDTAGFSTGSSCTTAHFGKNGHTFEVNLPTEETNSSPSGLWVDYGGGRYDLQSFHFTASSENTLNGLHYPAEMQLVHKERKGENMLIVSVWMLPAVGQSQSADYLRGIFSHGFNDENVQTGSNLNPYTALDLADQEFYSFIGSETTPPCSGGVRWLIKQTPEQIGTDELMAFKTYLLGKDEVR
jgi:carbonic anhydrase